MTYLSLFSGAGGGDLACQHLLDWTCVGYVEWNKYCGKIIEQRIKDGIFSDAPIFNYDIREFIEEGYAKKYRGVAKAITAGFPCVSFSIAGKRKAEDDERNQWETTIECIRLVQPEIVFLENVDKLANYEYFKKIIGDLQESGYNARWRCLSAKEVGGWHKRNRLWILCYKRELDNSN